MSSFENLRIVDNFYQTSLFFPMPTVIISTLCEDGTTTLGPYSLVQPYYVAGKDYYAMLLSCRNSSNTAQNILRNGKCAINFIDDNPKTFKEAVKLSWPGDKPSDKMPKCKFKLEKGLVEEETGEARPFVLTDAIEVIECTWVRELDGADKDMPGVFIFCSVRFVKSRIAVPHIVNLLLVLVLLSALFMSHQTPYDEDLYEYKEYSRERSNRA